MPRKKKTIVTPPGSLADEQEHLHDVVAIDAAAAKKSIAGARNAADLEAEIEALRERLANSEQRADEAEQKAIATASAQGLLMQSEIMEIPTGKTTKLRMLDETYIDDDHGQPGYKVVGYKDDAGGRPILKPVFKTVDVPTFFYKIDLPPCGGEFCRVNGIQFYHGTVVRVDLHLLRTLKEIVYRCWDHDRSIHGSDENFYRKPSRPAISGARA